MAYIASNQVKKLTGSDAASNITKSLINESGKELTGSGFKSKRGGSMNVLDIIVGIGYNSPSFSNPSERMAYVRAHKKNNSIVM